MTQMHLKEGETGAYNNRNKILLPFTEFFNEEHPFLNSLKDLVIWGKNNPVCWIY